jgi:5-methylthioribose kinase
LTRLTDVPAGYRPMQPDDVAAFAAPFLGGRTDGEVQEIGDGNLNLVFRVRAGALSVIVKQALPYLRVVGEGWPLTLDRARIEAEAMAVHAELAPGSGPTVLRVDPTAAAVVMEDLREHVVWRTALVGGRHVPGVAEQLGRYCARVLLGTSRLLMPDERRRALLPRFENPELSAITEDLVFSAPYVDAPTNRIDEAGEELAAQLRADPDVRAASARLRWEFRTRTEALLHGDLHSGSVMVRDGDARVIDVEFATFGPMAYDTGNVVANLAFARTAAAARGDGALAALVDQDAADYWDALTDEARGLWPATEPWREQFLDDLRRDTARYAATELVRRLVGLAHVTDIDTLPDGVRLGAQTMLVARARSLSAAPETPSFAELWARTAQEETP